MFLRSEALPGLSAPMACHDVMRHHDVIVCMRTTMALLVHSPSQRPGRAAWPVAEGSWTLFRWLGRATQWENVHSAAGQIGSPNPLQMAHACPTDTLQLGSHWGTCDLRNHLGKTIQQAEEITYFLWSLGGCWSGSACAHPPIGTHNKSHLMLHWHYTTGEGHTH